MASKWLKRSGGTFNVVFQNQYQHKGPGKADPWKRRGRPSSAQENLNL